MQDANFLGNNASGGLIADSLNESYNMSQHTGGGTGKNNPSLVSEHKLSAKDYLSERGSEERKVFRMILRSNENNAVNLKTFLSTT